jgi:hypothetical protein
MHHIGLLLILSASVAFAAEPIDVPNASFESPPVSSDPNDPFWSPFRALPWIDDWDEAAPGPDDDMEQNIGVFLNTDPGEPDHITNAHLLRLAFIQSFVGNDVRQELTATFVPGRHYRLTVGVCKSMIFAVGEDEPLEIALYYMDSNVQHIVSSSYVAGGHVGFTSLTDVTTLTRLVDANDPWANKPIGVLIRPAVDDPDDTVGEGFWDADHVRLEWFPALAGDLDGDGDVDDTDVATFNGCATGPEVRPLASGCEQADLDGDGDADQADFGRLQANLFLPG